MTLQADDNGYIQGQLTIPADTIPTGTKLIEFFGGANPLPSYAASSFVGRGTVNLVEKQAIRRRIWQITTLEWEDTRPPGDPLAQSFQVSEACQLSFVDLWCEGEKGPSDVSIQMREMVNGYPGPRVLAESILKPDQITLAGTVGVRDTRITAFGSGGTDGTFPLTISGGGGEGATAQYTVIDGSVAWIEILTPGSGYTSAPTLNFNGAGGSAGLVGAAAVADIGDYNRFHFDPTNFLPDVQYCVVAMCNDAVWRLRVAIMGDVDGPTQQRIAAQPYIVGVLFSSSNNITWTAHQDRDLRFRLGGPTYSVTEKNILITEQAVTNCDYLGLLGAIELPSNETAIQFEAVLPLPGSPRIGLRLNDFVLLPQSITGTVRIEATLYGTANLTPLLYPDMQLLAGTTQSPSVYETRVIDIHKRTVLGSPSTDPTKITVLFDQRGSGTVAVEVWDGENDAWVTLTDDETAYILPLADGWQERVMIVDDFDTANLSTKLKITLTGTAWARPSIRRLRVTFNENPA